MNLVPLSEVPAMSLCSVCPAPGHCCQKFYLYTTDDDSREATFWKDEVDREVEKRRPFTATVEGSFVDPDSGREYVRLLWSCSALQKDGRCGIYADRPDICRKFVPGTSPLCVFHPDNQAARAQLELQA